MSKLLIISATKGSNLELSKKICKTAEKIFHSTEVISLEDFKIPLYTPLEENNGINEDVLHLYEKLRECSSIVLCAPEYNGNIPPIVNNAICWISRASENWREAFNGKTAVIATSSGGTGFKFQLSMRMQLEHLGCVVLPRTVAVGGGKEYNAKSCEGIMKQLNLFSGRKNE
ncbi:MAG: NAD(P)H-dependent oxidoreductase [Halobacteriovoraceae bacterium]|nr:NAD(P)H-dependent oxidoreductase [Halobacteriovoraceae bacterium]